MAEITHGIHYDLSGQKEWLRLAYEPNCVPEVLADKLKSSLEGDMRLKSTSHGPHKDDLAFLVNDKDLKKFGSQGQQRTAALSLKIAELTLVEDLIKEPPVLLLDDVLSELDQHRQLYLMNRIQNIQTLFTCTGVEDVLINQNKAPKTLFLVENGKIIKQK